MDLTPAGKDVKIIKDGKREIIEVIEGVPTRLRCIATDSKPKTEITWSINGTVPYLCILILKNVKIRFNFFFGAGSLIFVESVIFYHFYMFSYIPR